jgi:hypothetical protein
MLLAAAALTYQGLIPAGYMLGTRSDLAAGLPVVPCPAQQEAALLPVAGHHHHHHGGSAPALHHADSCAFAVAAAAVLPPSVLAVHAPAEAPAAPVIRDAVSIADRSPPPLPPVRGPPVFS